MVVGDVEAPVRRWDVPAGAEHAHDPAVGLGRRYRGRQPRGRQLGPPRGLAWRHDHPPRDPVHPAQMFRDPLRRVPVDRHPSRIGRRLVRAPIVPRSERGARRQEIVPASQIDRRRDRAGRVMGDRVWPSVRRRLRVPARPSGRPDLANRPGGGNRPSTRPGNVGQIDRAGRADRAVASIDRRLCQAISAAVIDQDGLVAAVPTVPVEAETGPFLVAAVIDRDGPVPATDPADRAREIDPADRAREIDP